MKTLKPTSLGAWTVTATLALGGCATKDFVRETVAPVQTQVGDLQQRTATAEGGLKTLDGRTTATEGSLKTLDGRVAGSEQRIAALQQEALARAAEAQKLAANSPRFAMTTLLQDDRIRFDTGRAALTPQGGAELDGLLAKLKTDDQPVFVEIQGHTDARGSAAGNERLGLARAEAVRQYLARAGMPLHRLATISYGEAAPLADNASVEGRRQNRRVHLVVLR